MQSNNITVHHATDSDIEEVAILFNAYREFYGKDTDLSLAKNFIHERIVEHESTILVARIQDKCVGFVQLYPFFSSVNAKRLFVLNDLFVDQDHRRKGVATSLMESAVLYARKLNYGGLILETTDDNSTAQSLYAQLGWSEEVGIKHYFLDI